MTKVETPGGGTEGVCSVPRPAIVLVAAGSLVRSVQLGAEAKA